MEVSNVLRKTENAVTALNHIKPYALLLSLRFICNKLGGVIRNA